MIIPSIDIMNGRAVQLIGGREKVLDAGDPRPLAEQFGLIGEVAVIDLDAALGIGSNADIITDLLALAPCRVGGGIRSVESAIAWLDAGAHTAILGTAATPNILKELPKDRVIAALDIQHGEVMVEGWRRGTGENIFNKIQELEEYVSGFLITFIEREGTMNGVDLERIAQIMASVKNATITFAGGIVTAGEVASIDRLGADAQVGMALYTGQFDIASVLGAILTSDRYDNLWPTVVVDESGTALGLAYSSEQSVREAIGTRTGIYQSRSRGTWVKGATSGATQTLKKIDIDCDRDALRFTVTQQPPGFCHTKTQTCWGNPTGIPALTNRLRALQVGAPDTSYTKKLLSDTSLLHSKLLEEAEELTEAVTTQEVIHEAADLLYFTLVKLRERGIELSDVAQELDRRALKVTRRHGMAKPTKTNVAQC